MGKDVEGRKRGRKPLSLCTSASIPDARAIRKDVLRVERARGPLALEMFQQTGGVASVGRRVNQTEGFAESTPLESKIQKEHPGVRPAANASH